MKLYTLGLVGPRFTTITNATNASPIVITAAGHGLTLTDVVTIGGVTGNTNANGTYDPGSFTVTTNTITLTGKTGNGAFGGTAIASAPQQLITSANFPSIPGVTDNTKILVSKILFVPAPAGSAVLYVGTAGLNQATFRNVFRTLNPPPTTGIFDYYELDSTGDNVWPIVDYWVDAAKPSTEAVICSFWIR